MKRRMKTIGKGARMVRNNNKNNNDKEFEGL